MEYAGKELDGQKTIQDVLTNEATIQVIKTNIKNQIVQKKNQYTQTKLHTCQ